MVDPRYRRAGASPGADAPNQVPVGTGGGWVVIGLIVVALIGIGRCSSTSTNPTDNIQMVDMNVAQEALGSAIATQTTAPVETLSKASVRRGEAHLKLASAEGLAGEMIYSQNCYDALSRHFSWAKLDACGAFDSDAVLSLGDGDTTGFDKEAAWFESETVAGRYLKAATSAGEDPDKADTRLGDLQTRVAKAHPHDAKPSEGVLFGGSGIDANAAESSPLDLANAAASGTG